MQIPVYIINDVACMLVICDMIKGNELHVGNIDFELQAKVGDKCLCFILF